MATDAQGTHIAPMNMIMANGATALAYDDATGIVLAAWRHGDEYVTWNCQPHPTEVCEENGCPVFYCENGRYFPNILEAAENFKERVDRGY